MKANVKKQDLIKHESAVHQCQIFDLHFHVSKHLIDDSQVNYCRGEILHAYGDIASHCGRFGAESDWLNLGAPMYRCRA